MAKKTKTGGRTKGTPNKTTAENRQFFKSMFARLGPAIEAEAAEHPQLPRHRFPHLQRAAQVPTAG